MPKTPAPRTSPLLLASVKWSLLIFLGLNSITIRYFRKLSCEKKVINQSLLSLFCKATPYIKNCNCQIYCKNLLAFGGMAGEFSFIIFLLSTFMPRKIRWNFPALFYFLEEREDFFVCFVFCFLHSITCNSHCATVIDCVCFHFFQ